MAGRKSKLNSTVQGKIVDLLEKGVSVKDTCAYVGIAQSTFFDWLQRGDAGEVEYSEFSEAVSRAHNAAKVIAIGTLRSAMQPYTQLQTTTKTYSETRINKATNEPYEYVEKTVTKSVTMFAGDWRAAVEYLKRRFADEWGDRQKIDDWRSEAIEMIRRGELAYEALAEAFDESLATTLFREAGVSVQTATRQAD